MSKNPIIGFLLSPPPDHTLLPLTYNPPLPILAEYRLVMSKPCACFTFVYVQNLPAAHAFTMVWRLVCSFCHPSLTSYGVSYFLIPHSLWPTPFKGWALLDCRLFFLQPTLLPLPRSCPHFLPYHFAILVVMFFDLSLLDLFGPTAYSSLNDLIWSFGLCITLLVGSFVPFISFWASLAH